MANLIGKSLGRYHILEQLGEGGMAVVYKAYDTRLEADVGVKVIRTENILPSALDRTLKRFEREAKALARLTHPNIVRVTDFGEHDGKPYLVMPYLSGGTLKKQLGKPIEWQEAMRLLLPIARALDYAHRQNLIHRDVKPSNILITADGEPMLTDFGIAKVLDLEETADLTGTGMGIGTPEYMAPEQWTGKTSSQSDLYSLGVILYEMITGRKPYTAETPAAILLKQATEPLPRPSGIVNGLPDKVEKILIKALARDQKDRYGNMGDFSKAIENSMKLGVLPVERPKALPVSKPVGKTMDTMATVDQDWEEAQTPQTVPPTKREMRAKLQPSARAKTATSFGPLYIILGLVALVFGAFLISSIQNPTAPGSPPSPPNDTVTQTPAAVQAVGMTSTEAHSPLPTLTISPTETPPPKEYKIGYISGSQLYIADLSGEVFQVTDELETSSNNYSGGRLSISKNGQYIARSKDGIIYYINNLTGEDAPLIDSVYQRQYETLAWSYDGKYVFTTIHGYTGSWWSGIRWTKAYVISTTNLAISEILNKSGTHWFANAQWLPDDSAIAYWQSGDIFTLNPDTKQTRNITTQGTVNEAPFAWSPDGSQILLTFKNDKNIYLFDIESKEMLAIIESKGEYVRDIQWSRDGKKILYSSQGIYVYDLSTGENLFIHEGWNSSWSPDNENLLFQDTNNLYVSNTDGSQKKVIANVSISTMPFWINTTETFDIRTEDIVSEVFGSNYTICTWQRKWPNGFTEYQCHCSETFCQCYLKASTGWSLTSTRARNAVNSDIKQYGGSCESN
jgi:serine/threonine protein kinase